MNRIIRCQVENEFIRGAGQVIGAAGSHDDVDLELSFSPVWAGTAKKIVWFDALGENTVITALGTDLLIPSELETYRVSVPAEAKAVEGDMRLTIRGVNVEDGVETRAVVAATAAFRVLPALWDPLAGESGDVTASQADQLRQEIEAIKENIADAAKASSALAQTQKAAEEAKQSALDAGSDRVRAEGARDRAEDAKNRAERAGEGALSAQAAAEAARADTLAASRDAEAAKAAAFFAAEESKSSAQSAGQAASYAAASARAAIQHSGRPPQPMGGTWWLWDAERQEYVNSGVSCELEGPRGVGVERMELTRGDHSPGNTDVYTLTLTSGEKLDIPVYNGQNGLGVGDVLGVQFDLTIPRGAWDNGSAAAADSRLLALGTYKYLIWPDEGCREEAALCEVQALDILENGTVSFRCRQTPDSELVLHVLRLQLGAGSDVSFQGKSLAEILREVLEQTRGSCCETATDGEVWQLLEEVFGPSGTEDPDNTATDREVEEMLEEVFG